MRFNDFDQFSPATSKRGRKSFQKSLISLLSLLSSALGRLLFFLLTEEEEVGGELEGKRFGGGTKKEGGLGGMSIVDESHNY